ncbi:MAG: OmpH family outer membrane protein [Thermodesulfobacteriota bacterium]
MKKLVLTTVLCLAALAAACTQEAPKAPKVGVVDPNEVYTNCKAATEATQYLQTMSKSLQAEVMQAQKDMQDDSKDQKAKEENSKRFQETLMKYQSTVGKEQGRIVTILNEAFQKAVEEFRTKNNYALILTKESAVSFSPDADVTKGVIEAMNAMDIKWKPEEKQDEAKAEPAAPAAAPAEEKKAEEPKAEQKEEKKQ